MDYHLGESAKPMTHSHQLNWFKYKNQLNLVKNFELYGVLQLVDYTLQSFCKGKVSIYLAIIF